MRKHVVFLGVEQTAYYYDLALTILKWNYTIFLFKVM